MKWLARHTEAEYIHKSTRLHRVFAWLPVYIAGKMVWLETYEILQMYDVQEYSVQMEEKVVIFRRGAWINLSKRIIE